MAHTLSTCTAVYSVTDRTSLFIHSFNLMSACQREGGGSKAIILSRKCNSRLSMLKRWWHLLIIPFGRPGTF